MDARQLLADLKVWKNTAKHLAEVNAELRRQAAAHASLVQEMETLLREVAEMKYCDEDEERCEFDSGPFCGRHGDNFIHAELIDKARALLRRSPAECTKERR